MVMPAFCCHDRVAMRRILLPFLSLALIAASPASDEARQLMEAGQEARAFALVEAAAALSDDDAVDYLAWFYDTGRYVAQDQPRAARLYRQAAERGQRHAQWRLGVMLDTGEGVAEDPREAFQWISRAAAQGSPRAIVSMGVMYATGRGVVRDYAQSRRYYLAAARLGQAHGFYGVGVLYAGGQGVAADQQESLAWMLCAATLGDEEAQRASERFQLDSAATTAAAQRANEIFAELGITGHRIRFRDLDAERGQPIV
ncbi:MAG TPA: tetratricopeptide repeat protein [Allosphingosinicella sp.]|nr:tetratricopeptide repeat protein [Allosphingosinicella sp.]